MEDEELKKKQLIEDLKKKQLMKKVLIPPRKEFTYVWNFSGSKSNAILDNLDELQNRLNYINENTKEKKRILDNVSKTSKGIPGAIAEKSDLNIEILITLPNDDLTEAMLPYLTLEGIQTYQMILSEIDTLPKWVKDFVAGFRFMKGALKLLFT